MGKIINIAKELDTDILDREIMVYETFQQREPYIFVNHSMLETLDIKFKCSGTLNKHNKMIYEAYYKNKYKVFNNEDLKFGEVEIR